MRATVFLCRECGTVWPREEIPQRHLDELECPLADGAESFCGGGLAIVLGGK